MTVIILFAIRIYHKVFVLKKKIQVVNFMPFLPESVLFINFEAGLRISRKTPEKT